MCNEISYVDMNYTYEIIKQKENLFCKLESNYLLVKFKHPNYPLKNFCKKRILIFFPYDLSVFCNIKEYDVDDKDDYYEYSFNKLEKLLEHLDYLFNEAVENEYINFLEDNNICNIFDSLYVI